MQNQISPGMFYSELIEFVILLLIGSWVLFAWPHAVRRKIERGKITAAMGEAWLRQLPPKMGYVIMILGVGLAFSDLWREGLFGYSSLLALIPAAIAVALLIFWLRQRKT